ncbi:MAG: rod shape-determining protein MreD [Collinsella sp.]|nr:rod shape-determining protein MreD [Collinsella sp.]
MDVREPGHARRALAIVCAIAAVLQLALAPQVSILGGRFNFMLVLALVIAPSSDIRTAVLVGFFSGLFFDLTSSPVPVGLLSLLLTVACFALSTISHGMGGGLTPETLRMVAIGIILVNVAYALALVFIGIEGDLLRAVLVHGLASSILDALAAVPLLMFGGGGEQSRGFSARSKGSRFKSYKSLK